MSKKSTSGTGSDGDAECSFANDRSSDSEKSKCNLRQHLSDKDSASRTISSHALKNNVSIPASDSSSENPRTAPGKYQKSTPVPICDLDEDLYGVNDEFNKNLEYLKYKLQLLSVYDDDDPSPSYEIPHSLDAPSDTHSCNTESSCDGKSDYTERPKGYLSTRETYINLLSPSGKFKDRGVSKTEYPNSVQNSDSTGSHCTTIYKAARFSETDTSSVESYNIPLKKLCKREDSKCCLATLTQPRSATRSSPPALDKPKNVEPYSLEHSCTPRLENLAKSWCDIKDSPLKKPGLNNSILSLPINECSNVNCMSSLTSPPYLPPFKRRCTRSRTPSFVNEFLVEPKLKPEAAENTQPIFDTFQISIVSPNVSDVLLPPAEGNNIRPSTPSKDSTVSEENSKSPLSEIIGLSLNSPFSLVGDGISSNRSTPIVPTIRVIEKCYKKTEKTRRKNKIAPMPECASSESFSIKVTCFKDSSSSLSSEEVDTQTQRLLKRYYDTTSEISTNSCSSPPCEVSTCESPTSSFPSATTGTDAICVEQCKICGSNMVEQKRDSSLKRKGVKKPQTEMFDFPLCSSLDIPKIFMHVYDFPAFTKITQFSGTFVHDLCAGDWSDISYNERPRSYCCYRSQAEALFNSPLLSPRRYFNQHVYYNNYSSYTELTSETYTIDQLEPKDYTAKRKNQSTKMSFYSIPSTTLDEELNSINLGENDNSFCSDEVDEVNIDCFCCGLFFPKKKKGFFI